MPSYVMLFPVIVLSSAFVEIDRYASEKANNYTLNLRQ